jgi:gustatory receptor
LCDRILKEHDKLLDLAWRLKTSPSASRPQKKKELETFTDFVECNRPEFTAARFFPIDRSTLFKILDASITFILVMLQFD